MNNYSLLLSRAAEEVRSFVSKNAPKSPPLSAWNDLANSMSLAASQPDDEKAEYLIDVISRRVIDEFPLNQDYAPSFDKALDGLQRKRKKIRRRKQK